MRRDSLIYLGLIVGAYMVGLGNIWKFPALILKYGLGGLITYLLLLPIGVILIASAMEGVRKAGKDLIYYFNDEFKLPALATLFAIFVLLILSYYPLIAGWILASPVAPNIVSSLALSIVVTVVVFALVYLAVSKGQARALDVMVFSVIAFFVIMILQIAILLPKANNLGAVLSEMFKWKGISPQMVSDMALQMAYSLSLGMGFYLILGLVVPRKYSTVSVAGFGALIDTLASLLSTFFIAEVIAITGTKEVAGLKLVLSVVPQAFSKAGLGFMEYIFAVGVFLVAFSSIIPLYEVVTRTVEVLGKTERKSATRVTFALGVGLTILVLVLMDVLGLPSIDWFDGASSTFVLFGGAIASWGVFEGKVNLGSLTKLAGFGMVLVIVLGLYSLSNLIVAKNYVAVLLLTSIVAVVSSLNKEISERL